MRPGEVIAERFEIQQHVGSGGMGIVFRAMDRASGEAVAVKLLLDRKAASAARFLREAEVLASLHHPGIVRHVAHGELEGGAPYLAMEWLSGEDLASRLRRGAIPLGEAMAIVARAADALGAVHARGIVHRDLKPSNLFLVEGDATQVKILDFGVARVREAPRMTETGAIVGSVGYMAPEQARSEGEPDASADVFSLGCVLYELVTGVPAFAGANVMAVLAKVLFAEPAPAREIRPDLPGAIDRLCARMLAKDRRDRPRDGTEVAAAIRAVALAATRGPGSERLPGTVISALTDEERHVLSVVLISATPSAGVAGDRDAGDQGAESFPDLRRTASAHGGEAEVLADGSILITLVGTGIATDLAAQAARCALALHAHARGRSMALATGRAEVRARLPAGGAIDRAVAMIADPPRVPGRAAPIAIDELTAWLLDARFEVIEADLGLVLCGEHALGPSARTLLGRPTACVGRDREIATLVDLFAECVEEPRAHAVLITAPAGMGKTRIAHELLRRARQRAELTLWVGRGDPMRVDASLGMIGQAIMGAIGLNAGDPIEARREAILAKVGEDFRGAEAQRVAEFLGEIVGTPFLDAPSVQLLAARRDAQLMGDQMRAAWVDFLAARCARGPILLVLEDLHWGDLPSVRFVDEALRRIRDSAWMVIALARPEVHERFPRLWSERHPQELRLGELTPKASARLVRQVLGEEVRAETVERLVAQADGNAFYLEELIRVAAEGERETLPETVLAMIQGRLQALDPEARRVLRAASIFGMVFSPDAVRSLLGDDLGARAVDERIDQLERSEWIYARVEARLRGAREMVFRHALVREAAHGMLTDEDRALGHRLAATWLERAGEARAAVIAEHLERGGEPARAAIHYRRAADQALAGNDFGAVILWTDRALGLGPDREARGEIALIRAEALRWRADLAEAGRWAEEALAALPRGGPTWYAAMGEAAAVARMVGQSDRLAALADEVMGAWREEEVSDAAMRAAAQTAFNLLLMGLYDRAEALHLRIEASASRFTGDPSVSACVFEVRCVFEELTGNVGRSRALAAAAIECFEQAGNTRNACRARISLGDTECLLGAYAAAEPLLRAALLDAERLGLASLLGGARANLGRALLGSGAVEEALRVEEQAALAFTAQGAQRMEGGSRTYLAQIRRRMGALEDAEREARRAVALLDVARPMQIIARGTLAEVLLARGRAEEALAEAREAMALISSLGKMMERDAIVRLALAEALAALGEADAARGAIADARDRLLAQAAKINDPTRRGTFLENVPEHARTLALARRWLDEAADPLGADLALGVRLPLE